VACQWDLTGNTARRAYWLDLFRGHFPKLLAEAERVAEADGEDPAAAQAAREGASAAFAAYLGRIADEPEAFGPLTILDICYQRERALRQFGIADPYRIAKQVENEQAMSVLPQLLSELDAMPEPQRHQVLIEGVFAGNIFDLGATKTVDMFAEKRVDFHQTRARLKPRPWYIDGLDAWLARMQGPAHRAAVLFVDNAGPDVILGMLPLARELVRRGTRVILTANTHPSLNDITHDELVGLVETAAARDRVIGDAVTSGTLRLIPSGNWAPLIDLTQLSTALVAAVESEPVDLVVLEGMGRGIESNFEARLSCECLKIAMIKDQGVADALGEELAGCKLFDLVMKYEPAEQ